MIFIDLDAKDELTPQNMRQLVARARRVLPRAITRSSRPRRDGELCRTTRTFPFNAFVVDCHIVLVLTVSGQSASTVQYHTQPYRLHHPTQAPDVQGEPTVLPW